MATLKTDLATLQSSATLARDRASGNALTGRLVTAFATYTMTGAEAAGDVINIASLPIGAVFCPTLSRVVPEACGGTGTTIAPLGDVGDVDRYSATAIVLTSAATLAIVATAAIELTPYAIASGN